MLITPALFCVRKLNPDCEHFQYILRVVSAFKSLGVISIWRYVKLNGDDQEDIIFLFRLSDIDLKKFIEIQKIFNDKDFLALSKDEFIENSTQSYKALMDKSAKEDNLNDVKMCGWCSKRFMGMVVSRDAPVMTLSDFMHNDLNLSLNDADDFEWADKVIN